MSEPWSFPLSSDNIIDKERIYQHKLCNIKASGASSSTEAEKLSCLPQAQLAMLCTQYSLTITFREP